VQYLARQVDPTNEFWLADVGCGTGEITVGLALQFPKAHVVAFDVNERSLEHARTLARRAGAKITFIQCDIESGVQRAIQESREALAKTQFDVVTSFGVLHHLSDPVVGFRAIREITAPQGLFLCYVYSLFGRWQDKAIRELLDGAVPNVTAFDQRHEALTAMRLSRGRHDATAFVKGIRTRLRFGPPMIPSELLRVYL